MLGRLLSVIIATKNPEGTARHLRDRGVPVAEDPCRVCADLCDEGHLEMPRMGLDTFTDFFGSAKPLRRQILVSTGTMDWPSKIENVSGTLAYNLMSVSNRLSGWKPLPKGSDVRGPGVFTEQESARLSILNASHSSVAEEHGAETVLVFPDFKAVVGAGGTTSAEAEELWRHSIDPSLGPLGALGLNLSTTLRSHILPYAAVVMICSHKRRDNRCGMTAPLLIETLIHELTVAGWQAHQNLEFDHYSSAEDSLERAADPKAHMVARLQEAADSKSVLIVGVSHVGGHKWAGLMQIFTPQGTGIFYGRVTTHDIPAIVKSTIIQRKILPEICRGVMTSTTRTALEW